MVAKDALEEAAHCHRVGNAPGGEAPVVVQNKWHAIALREAHHCREHADVPLARHLQLVCVGLDVLHAPPRAPEERAALVHGHTHEPVAQVRVGLKALLACVPWALTLDARQEAGLFQAFLAAADSGKKRVLLAVPSARAGREERR